MPKISELSDPGSGYNVTGGELIVVTTQGLSSIALSANDLIDRTIDATTTGTLANLKATHTDFNANSARYDRTALSLETNVVPSTANWNQSYITSNNNFSTLNSNSARWNTNANTEVAAASARYNRTAASVETNVVPATGSWNSTNTTLVANSARYDRTALSLETNVVPNSASWTTAYNSTQTELKGNSASWTTGYNSTQTELKSI